MSPIDWSEVVAPAEARAFVTFVNPSLAQRRRLFARLADMLGAARPDIPILVVQSATGAGSLNAHPRHRLRKYPQIMACAAVAAAGRLFRADEDAARAVPVRRAAGRVAAEAMINGIPPLVSNRGGCLQTAAGGRGVSCRSPNWLTGRSARSSPKRRRSSRGSTPSASYGTIPGSMPRPRGSRVKPPSGCTESRCSSRRYLHYFASLGPGSPLFE